MWGRELEVTGKCGQPGRSSVAGMSLVCSRNEKEARVNGAKWPRGRVASMTLAGRQVTDLGGTVDQAKQ